MSIKILGYIKSGCLDVFSDMEQFKVTAASRMIYSPESGPVEGREPIYSHEEVERLKKIIDYQNTAIKAHADQINLLSEQLRKNGVRTIL